jgi:protein required for attachment to host cells
MSKAWVLVADSSRARIFAVDTPRGPLREIEDLVHPPSRLHDRELGTDRPGRSFDSAGEGRHAMEQDVSAKEQEVIYFAGDLASRLEAGRTRREYDRLILVAPPAFLGVLRKKISGETAKMVTQEIDKGLAQLPERELREHLPERL